jgi:hypothetical protein
MDNLILLTFFIIRIKIAGKVWMAVSMYLLENLDNVFVIKGPFFCLPIFNIKLIINLRLDWNHSLPTYIVCMIFRVISQIPDNSTYISQF